MTLKSSKPENSPLPKVIMVALAKPLTTKVN